MLRILVLTTLLLALGLPASGGQAKADPVRPFLAQSDERAGDGEEAGAPSSGIDLEERLEKDRRVARSRFRYLALGYGLIWLSLGTYLLSLHRRVGKVRREIASLEARLGDLSGR